MTKTLGILRGEIRRLDKRLENQPEVAKAKIRTMEVKRINLVSLCRAFVDRLDLTPEARHDAFIKKMAEYICSVETSKDEALGELKKSHDEAETILLQLSEFSEHRPGADEWPKYQALSSDVQRDIEEVAKTSPDKIREMYAKAERLEDSITCFAIERFGPRAIDAAQRELSGSGASFSQTSKYIHALRDLTDIIDKSNPEQAALKFKARAIQKDIDAAKTILEGYQLPSDEINIRKQFRISTRDGLSQLYLECGAGYVSSEDGHLARQLSDDENRERPPVKISLKDVFPPGSIVDKVESRVRKLKKEAEKDE